MCLLKEGSTGKVREQWEAASPSEQAQASCIRIQSDTLGALPDPLIRRPGGVLGICILHRALVMNFHKHPTISPGALFPLGFQVEGLSSSHLPWLVSKCSHCQEMSRSSWPLRGPTACKRCLKHEAHHCFAGKPERRSMRQD